MLFCLNRRLFSKEKDIPQRRYPFNYTYIPGISGKSTNCHIDNIIESVINANIIKKMIIFLLTL